MTSPGSECKSRPSAVVAAGSVDRRAVGEERFDDGQMPLQGRCLQCRLAVPSLWHLIGIRAVVKETGDELGIPLQGGELEWRPGVLVVGLITGLVLLKRRKLNDLLDHRKQLSFSSKMLSMKTICVHSRPLAVPEITYTHGLALAFSCSTF